MNFRRNFWVGDHFAEYIHPQRGIIANHGLTDVDWSAIATGVASPEQVAILWPQLKDEQRFYYGGMPTGIATHPERYEDWEFFLPDWHDLAAMGRVWYTECWARARMGDGDGIVNSIRRVCKAGRDNGYYWWERYYPNNKGGYTTGGPNTYCEYPANLIRIIQRFLLGIEFQLDGTIVIAPTAPAEFWQKGFGQKLLWRGQSLSYQMREGLVTGNFSGTQSQRLYLRLNRQSRSTKIQVAINGYLVSPKIQGDFIIIDLPCTEQSCNFEVRVLS